uniref:Uncharacterized protein n=1 Tax=Aegilops tauschii subsp. strangulata TaxID=200361 RepID=A0A453AUY3_AEGTS
RRDRRGRRGAAWLGGVQGQGARLRWDQRRRCFRHRQVHDHRDHRREGEQAHARPRLPLMPIVCVVWRPGLMLFLTQIIFDFRFLALLAVAGSLAGSLLCFLNGCVYIKEAYCVYWTSCAKGVHTGQMVLKVVEAIDVYLAGTVMLIFGMGLYGLFISNASNDLPSGSDRALQGSSLFGMFALKERPKWMKITSLDELKTKVGHVIVMILLVKMFERSKMVKITTGLDLLSYSVCIFLSSASLYILHNLHRPEHEESVMPHL